MTSRELGSYDVLVDILTNPDLAGGAALNGRPFGG